MSAIDKLIEISGPAFSSSSPGAQVNPEIENLLKRKNGFFAFEGALKVFCYFNCEASYSVTDWNNKEFWKYEYGDILDDYFCFAENIFGEQFCYKDTDIYMFEPETAKFTFIANTLEEWASKILVEYYPLLGYKIAHDWQEKNGVLDFKKRLLPTQLFFMGGSADLGNLKPVDEVEGMRVRGSIYQQTKDLPDGTQVELKVVD